MRMGTGWAMYDGIGMEWGLQSISISGLEGIGVGAGAGREGASRRPASSPGLEARLRRAVPRACGHG